MEKLKNIISDRELWFVLVFNMVLAIGYLTGYFSMDTLVWIYYFQSILIGIGNTVRMALLKDYSTANFQVNGQPVEANASTKRFSALFFLFHYGFFHLVYLIFLVVSSFDNGSKLDFRLVLINVILIAGNTLVSTWSNVLQDRINKPAISSMFFTPYLRVFPMHLFIMIGFTLKTETVIAGIAINQSNLFWVFLMLKIISDSLMHIIVQKSWREKRVKPTEGFI